MSLCQYPITACACMSELSNLNSYRFYRMVIIYSHFFSCILYLYFIVLLLQISMPCFKAQIIYINHTKHSPVMKAIGSATTH